MRKIFFIIPIIIVQGCTSTGLLEINKTTNNIMKSLDKMDSLNKNVVKNPLDNKKPPYKSEAWKLEVEKVSYKEVIEKYKSDKVNHLPLNQRVLSFIRHYHAEWKQRNRIRKDNVGEIVKYNKNFLIMLKELDDYYNSKSFKLSSYPNNVAIYKPSFKGNILHAPDGSSYSPRLFVTKYPPTSIYEINDLKKTANTLKIERVELINKTKKIEKKEIFANKELKRLEKKYSMIINKKNNYIKMKKASDKALKDKRHKEWPAKLAALRLKRERDRESRIGRGKAEYKNREHERYLNRERILARNLEQSRRFFAGIGTLQKSGIVNFRKLNPVDTARDLVKNIGKNNSSSRKCSDSVTFSFDGPGADVNAKIQMSGASGVKIKGNGSSSISAHSSAGCIEGKYQFNYFNNANWFLSPDNKTYSGSFSVPSKATHCKIVITQGFSAKISTSCN